MMHHASADRWLWLAIPLIVWLGTAAGALPAAAPPPATAGPARVESLNLIITQSTEGELEPCGH